MKTRIPRVQKTYISTGLSNVHPTGRMSHDTSLWPPYTL